MNELFESWVLAQFGKDKRALLSKINGEYVDEMINAMWVGFNAHAEITK